MIRRGSAKVERFIDSIGRTVDPSHREIPAERLTRDALDAGDRAIYLGAGYWRALPIWDDDALLGVRLVNPERSGADCRQVERGIAILRHYEYREDGA